MLNWIILILVGKLVIYLAQKFHLPKFLEENKTISYLHVCDLCLGVWVYALLAYIFQVDLLVEMGAIHISFVGEWITGGILSFTTHIFSIGWREKFNTVVVI